MAAGRPEQPDLSVEARRRRVALVRDQFARLDDIDNQLAQFQTAVQKSRSDLADIREKVGRAFAGDDIDDEGKTS